LGEKNLGEVVRVENVVMVGDVGMFFTHSNNRVIARYEAIANFANLLFV